MNKLMTGGVALGAGTLAANALLKFAGIPMPDVLYLGSTLLGCGISALGVALNKNEVEEFFRKELDNPAIDLLSCEKREYGEIHYLKIPLGLRDFDFDKYAKKLSEQTGKSVLIAKEVDKIKCIVYEFGYAYDSLAETENGIQNALKAVCMFSQQTFADHIKVYEKTEYNNGYILHIPHVPGISITEYNKARNHLKEIFDAEIEISYQDKFIALDVYTKKLEDKYPYEKITTSSPTELLIGHTPKEIKLYDLKNGHILVGGTTGSGKSTWERSAIVNLILNNTPEDLMLNLHDNKIVEYGIFRDCNMVKNFTFTVDKLSETLTMLEKESAMRYKMFDKENILDVTQWNEEHPDKKLKYIITFIAEFAQLAGYDKLMNSLRKRLEMDRAAGLYYVISLQRGSKDLIPTNIKSNLDTRISFRTADSTNAWIILDQINTSENIKQKGRGILKEGGEMKDFQAVLLSSKEAIKLVEHTFKNTKED